MQLIVDGHATKHLAAILHARRDNGYWSHTLLGLTGIFMRLEEFCKEFDTANGILLLKVHTHGVHVPGLDELLREPQLQVVSWHS